MAEFTVKELELVREIPGNPAAKGGPAKVLKVHFEEDERRPELFATAKTPLPKVGEKIDENRLTFNQQWNRWEFVKQSGGGGGGGRPSRSPGETKAIQRQHSQEMALRREANVIASGGRAYTADQMRSVINWFEADIATKDRGVLWDGFSDDVPVDDEGLPDQVRIGEEDPPPGWFERDDR